MDHRDAVAELRRGRQWRKSTWSDGANTCVEVTTEVPGWVGVRDSKLGTSSPVLAFTAGEWTAFLSGAKGGEFDQVID